MKIEIRVKNKGPRDRFCVVRRRRRWYTMGHISRTVGVVEEVWWERSFAGGSREKATDDETLRSKPNVKDVPKIFESRISKIF